MTHDQTPPPLEDNMLLLAEVAEELRVDVRTVYGLLRSGALPHVDLGYRTKRVRRSVLDAYLKSREAGECS